MTQVYIDNKLVYEGALNGRCSGGGTKTPFDCGNTPFVVLLPNAVDGQALERVYPRICYEEETMYKYLRQNNLAPCLPVTTCSVKFESGKVLPGLYAPAFELYIGQGGYVLDTKNKSSSCWNNKLCINPTFEDVDSWVPIFAPLLQDLRRLMEGGIWPSGDCLNFIITSPGFEHHVDAEVPFQVRFFGFDFTSKRYVSDRVQSINTLPTGTLLKPVQDELCFEDAVDLAVHEVLNTTQTREANFETLRALCESVKQKVLKSC
jgi:hypothetical protein